MFDGSWESVPCGLGMGSRGCSFLYGVGCRPKCGLTDDGRPGDGCWFAPGGRQWWLCGAFGGSERVMSARGEWIPGSWMSHQRFAGWLGGKAEFPGV